jgi:ankyrin repeat protein
VLTGDEDAPQEDEDRATLLHLLAELADPRNYSTHEHQLILAKQLIEHGAKVDAVSIPDSKTPLHNACSGGNVTNLDFIELLLKAGADPNAQNYTEMTPLMLTTTGAPGAAKFLLNWPTTDVNIFTQSGLSFLYLARLNIKNCSDQIAPHHNLNQV